MRKWDAGEEAVKEPEDGNELIAHRRSTYNQQNEPKS